MFLFPSSPGVHVRPRPMAAAMVACLWAVWSAAAAAESLPPLPVPTLNTALDAAWRLSAGQRSLFHRQAALDARQQAADAWLSAAPSVTLSQRSDRLHSNLGLREYEAGLALPLWSPGVRAATADQVGADQAVLRSEPQSSKLKLAGELRDIAASAAGAALELVLAERRLAEAQLLVQDTRRRVSSGDSPRIDTLQASAAERQAAGQVSQAQRALAELRGQWRTLTGLTQIATPDETIPAASADAAVNQPLVLTAQTRVRAAQARLALTEADRRDAPELGVGITREKALAGDVAQNALRLSLRIPFGSTHRNAPRLAAARAELDTAYAELDATQRQVQTDLVLAREALQAAQAAAILASERAEFSAQAQALVARSYDLGESDLPSRLRADSDRFDAELAATRARADTQRAIARLNQSSGRLP